MTRIPYPPQLALLLALAWLVVAACTAHAAPLAPGGAGSSASQSPQVYPTVGPASTSPSAGYALAFAGKAVKFDLGGFEPDFDPLYTVTVSGTLHDRRAAPPAASDATLILSSYLEVFQPDTTPVLPDLVHPDQVAGDLAGFLSGKAALVNAGGRIVYRGSLLAEIFQDSTEHLVVDLEPVTSGQSVRLQGAITLHKGGAEGGTLRALQPLARALLAVPRGPAPSWQAVANSLGVQRPAMMGTAGSSSTGATQRQPAKLLPAMAPQPAARTALLPLPLAVALGALVILAILAVPAIWRHRGSSRSPPHPRGDHRADGIHAAETGGAEDAIQDTPDRRADAAATREAIGAGKALQEPSVVLDA